MVAGVGKKGKNLHSREENVEGECSITSLHQPAHAVEEHLLGY